MKKKFLHLLQNEFILCVAILGAIITSFLSTPTFKDINFHVLMILFNLMIVVEIYKKESILDFIAINFLKKYNNQKTISALLILLVFIFGMFLTNDVALITFVPLTLIIGKKANFPIHTLIILETFAANLGGVLTPMGSPQNLYIFSKYNLTPIDFFATTGLISLIGLAMILLCNLQTPNNALFFQLDMPILKKNYNATIATIIFSLVILSILLNFSIFPVTIFTILFLIYHRLYNSGIFSKVKTSDNSNNFHKIDWFLLLTFVAFFIFIGNLSRLSYIASIMSDIISTNKKLYLESILFSQFISNVPTAILFSEFTTNWKPLLIGVNIGNFGTLIASLANLISYKLYINEFPQERNQYLKISAILNTLFLIILGTIFYNLV